MPSLRAGRLHRYAMGRDVGALIAPPYDVIDEGQQRELLESSPYNAVRLTLPGVRAGEGVAARYARARATFDGWAKEGIVAPDVTPNILIVEQSFRHPVSGERIVRTGLEALLQLGATGDVTVRPHERTLAAPRSDRLELLNASELQASLVFLLVPDPLGELVGQLAAAKAGVADFEGSLGGVDVRAWRVHASEPLLAPLQGVTGYIADGHHRFETAMKFRDLVAARDGAAKDHRANFLPAHVVPMGDPGLVVLPTHRLVRAGAFDAGRYEARVGRLFTRRTVAGVDLPGLVEAGRVAPSFLLVRRERTELLTLRPDVDLAALEPSEALRSLDVTILHQGLFVDVLGHSRESESSERNLAYEKAPEQAVAAVTAGAFDAAVLMNATTLAQIRRAADAGERLPQKSTYFFPKVFDGLGFWPIDGVT